MKKLLISLAVILFSVTAYTQTRLYVNPDFSQKTKNHKVIAVLPFQITLKLRPNQLRNTTPKQLKNMEYDQGKEFSQQCSPGFWLGKKKDI